MTSAFDRLQPLLAPRSIAIVGASENAARVGGMPLALCQQHGFAGALYPVNPKYGEINGLKCYPDIESIPEPADLVALAVAAEQVAPQLRRLAARGCRSAVVFASGFAETGDAEGRRLTEDLQRTVEEIGIPVAGPNCMGFANLASHAYTAFASVFRFVPPPEGDRGTALVTQSGNVCATVYAQARQLGVGFGIVVNTGNEATLEFSEYLEYFAEDPSVTSVLGYVEGLRDGDRFRRVADRLNRKGVPLALLKIGDTEKGAEAAASHTAALSGEQAVYRAVFDELNVIQAEDLTHLADIAYLGRFREKTAGKKVAVLTISGALGALLSDKFLKLGLDVPTLSDNVQAILRSGIPNYGMVANPVDLTGNVVNDHAFFGSVLEALQESDEIDTIVLYAPGYLLDKLAPAVIAGVARTTKMLAVIDTLNGSVHSELENAGVPVFTDTARATNALAAFARWSERTRQVPSPSPMPAPPAPEAEAILRAAAAKGQRALDEVAGKRLISLYGAPAIPERACATAGEAETAAAEFGFPAVVKILSPDILHKSDSGGVKLNLRDVGEVREAFTAVTEAAIRAYPDARIHGVVVQKQEEPGVEVLVGVTTDPVFGKVMTVGLGGIFTEILKDVRHKALPLSRNDAKRMLESLQGYPLLAGTRGRPPCDLDALATAVAAISDAALAHPEISEIECNPVVARPGKPGISILDCLVTLSDHSVGDAESASHGEAEKDEVA